MPKRRQSNRLEPVGMGRKRNNNLILIVYTLLTHPRFPYASDDAYWWLCLFFFFFHLIPRLLEPGEMWVAGSAEANERKELEKKVKENQS